MSNQFQIENNLQKGEVVDENLIRQYPNYSRFLPIANINRIMKKALPENAKIAKDAKETVQECVSEFISFITSEACEKCKNEKRKTINGEDLLYAINTLGFESYVDILKLYLSKYREVLSEAKIRRQRLQKVLMLGLKLKEKDMKMMMMMKMMKMKMKMTRKMRVNILEFNYKHKTFVHLFVYNLSRSFYLFQQLIFSYYLGLLSLFGIDFPNSSKAPTIYSLNLQVSGNYHTPSQRRILTIYKIYSLTLTVTAFIHLNLMPLPIVITTIKNQRRSKINRFIVSVSGFLVLCLNITIPTIPFKLVFIDIFRVILINFSLLCSAHLLSSFNPQLFCPSVQATPLDESSPSTHSPISCCTYIIIKGNCLLNLVIHLGSLLFAAYC